MAEINERKRQQERLRQSMHDRKMAYTVVFGQETAASKLVLADMKRFCRAESSCWNPDPRIHALLEGRREVVLRILDHLELSVDDLLIKYGGTNVLA